MTDKISGDETIVNNGGKLLGEFIPIKNPYRPFNSGEWFYNEKAINQIKEVFQDEKKDRIIVLQGKPGAGKTSTLKRIEEAGHKDVLGDRYVPVYIDSRKYIENGKEFNDLLTSLYRDISDKLSSFGYSIEKPQYSKEKESTDEMIKRFLLNTEIFLHADDFLVLIFDELDYFLEKVDAQVLSTLIDYIEKLQMVNWNRYAVILAGDKRLDNLIRVKYFNRLLKNAPRIDIEEFLEPETIKKLIKEPVQDRVIYDDDAVEQIIYYSGKNLFFQQLICYYVVQYLNQVRHNRCSLEDVDRVIDNIVNLDPEPKQFNYAWNYKLDLNGKILGAALADATMTRNEGNYYYLNENSLLDKILGDQLFPILKNLQDFDYIEKNQERRFQTFPFCIPLYGQWIGKEHPFLKTVIENIQEVAEKVDFKQLIQGIRSMPADKLAPLDQEVILRLADQWSAIMEQVHDRRTILNKLNPHDFIKELAAFLHLHTRETQGGHRGKDYLGIDIGSLNIGILDEAICFFQDKPELSEGYRSTIENFATAQALDTQSKLILFFCPIKSDMIQRLVKKTYLNLIALDENDIKKIICSAEPREYFRKTILKELSLEKVSPYQTAGVAKTNFYGRIEIINRIIRNMNTSYAIVGSRKIGKSSLLWKIKENQPLHTAFIFMDLEYEFSNVKNYNTFLKSLKTEIADHLKKKVNFGFLPFFQGINRLPAVLRKLSRNGNRVVFILDEMDKLLEFDKNHDYQLMRIFRNLSQENLCQFIFAGFRELYHIKRDINNPLYNFYEEIPLLPLEKEHALELVTKPMESIGVKYHNENDRELIFHYTAGHPNLIQFFCKHLLEQIEKHEDISRRIIFQEDIEAVFNTTYEAYIIDQVYMFNSDLKDIDKLILLLLVERYPAGISFSTEDIRNCLIDAGIEIDRREINQYVKNLVMRFILLDKGRDKYTFALSVFPDILQRCTDPKLKDQLTYELKREYAKSV